MSDDTVDTTTAAWTSEALPDGPYVFAVRAVDGAYHWSETATFDVTIDADAPSAPTVTSATHPAGGSSAGRVLFARRRRWAP